MPKYPTYSPQPYTGNLLTGKQGGPMDARFTSLTAPAYQGPIDRRYGRMLAGDDNVQAQATQSPDNAWAVNELEALRELDDVQGDGIFDPPGTHPNIYADAGVFAGRYSLPGYHVREVPFMHSEVRDATTGRPIIPVPNGAVSLDTPAKLAQLERQFYTPAQPVVWSNRGGQVRDQSTVNVVQNPEPVKGIGRWGIGVDAPVADPTAVAPAPPVAATDTGKTIMTVIGVGLAAGALYALLTK
jgi:hypothetical protein